MPGSITHISGHNGIGKSTLLKIIAGIITKYEGNISFCNTAMPNQALVNYIGHELALKAEFTILENIQFWAKIYNSSPMIASALSYLGLSSLQNEKVANLSAGNKKKVALARLMACKSRIWLLDEIDTNLDQTNKELIHNCIYSKANNGGIIIYTGHNNSNLQSNIKINLEDYA